MHTLRNGRGDAPMRLKKVNLTALEADLRNVSVQLTHSGQSFFPLAFRKISQALTAILLELKI